MCVSYREGQGGRWPQAAPPPRAPRRAISWRTALQSSNFFRFSSSPSSSRTLSNSNVNNSSSHTGENVSCPKNHRLRRPKNPCEMRSERSGAQAWSRHITTASAEAHRRVCVCVCVCVYVMYVYVYIYIYI